MTHPRLVLQYGLSGLFIVQMYLAMPILALYYTPLAVLRRDAAFDGVQTFCRWVRFTARIMVGLHSEVRGPVPQDAVMIASKHQSFFDIIILVSVLPRPKFIMKKQIKWAPIVGWYAMRMGCIPVDRGKRSQAIQKMLADVQKGHAEGGQLVIYPQGTRVAPDAARPYKIGTGALYSELDQACVPAATNVGVFWPRHGILRKPGRAVVAFLPTIAPGLDRNSFMARLEQDIESASDALMAEAGYDAPAARAEARGSQAKTS